MFPTVTANVRFSLWIAAGKSVAEMGNSEPLGHNCKRFALDAEAIDHSIRLAARFRRERLHEEPDLLICVLDESGREIHRELVHPTGADLIRCDNDRNGAFKPIRR